MDRRALVVDDDTISRLVLAHMLRRAGWEVSESDDIGPAAELAASSPFRVIFSDFSMPGGTGMDLFRMLGPATSRPLFVLVTGMVAHAFIGDEAAHQVDAFLTKPISTHALVRCLADLHLALPAT